MGATREPTFDERQEIQRIYDGLLEGTSHFELIAALQKLGYNPTTMQQAENIAERIL